MKIWFQNHRYKTKKQRTDCNGGVSGIGCGMSVMESLGHMTSPRRVPVPVLVRDGRPVMNGSNIAGSQSMQGSITNDGFATQATKPSQLHLTPQNQSSYSHFLDYRQQSQSNGQSRGLQSTIGIAPHHPYSDIQNTYSEAFQNSCHPSSLTYGTSNGIALSDQSTPSAFTHMMSQPFYHSGNFSFPGEPSTL